MENHDSRSRVRQTLQVRINYDSKKSNLLIKFKPHEISSVDQIYRPINFVINAVSMSAYTVDVEKTKKKNCRRFIIFTTDFSSHTERFRNSVNHRMRKGE